MSARSPSALRCTATCPAVSKNGSKTTYTHGESGSSLTPGPGSSVLSFEVGMADDF
jgi:hypothetical protein